MAARRKILPAPTQKPRPDLSLAIVNIVLLLILFFMVTGSFTAPRGTEVALSETSDLPIDSLPQPILIVMDDGTFQLNERPVDPALLGDQLAGEEVLHILIGRDALAGDLLGLLSGPEFDGLDIRLVTLHLRGAS